MSTTTTNLGLVKPEYSDTADVQEINQNMDKVDDAVGAAQNSFAILADGNAHAAILSGQFVYVRNHDTLSEGLYNARAAIPTNGALSTSNLTAVSGGGLNALNDSIRYLINNVAYDADVDRNIESNRTNVMDFLLENYFYHGHHFAMVRYAEGYYYGYVYVGKYDSSEILIVEIPHNSVPLIIWRKTNGAYAKTVIA